jgi:hypothetical protein
MAEKRNAWTKRITMPSQAQQEYAKRSLKFERKSDASAAALSFIERPFRLYKLGKCKRKVSTYSTEVVSEETKLPQLG